MDPDLARRYSPADVNSLVTVAHQAIRSQILRGTYELGEHLVETRIADELETSRAPIREALGHLEQEGLVVKKPRRGFFVREISAQDFVDIYNVRIAIECAAARLVAVRQPSLTAIDETVSALHQAAREGDVSSTVDLELLVHQQICDASGNSYLASVFKSVAGPARMALALDDAAYENLEDAATEHLPLLEALRSGDPNRAAQAIHDHIVSTVAGPLARLGGDTKDLFAGPPIPAAE